MNRIWEKEPPLLSVKGLKKTFGKKTVVDDVSFDVFPGEVIAVVGGIPKASNTACIPMEVVP